MAITQENIPSVQMLAEFLRDVSYSEKLFHKVDHSLYVNTPKDGNGDLLYKGGLYTHNRVETPLHYYGLSFCYTETRGIFSVNATQDECEIETENAMGFDQFRDFVMTWLDVQDLYASHNRTSPQKVRRARKAPTLQDMVEFMAGVSVLENEYSNPLGWSMRVVHPRDLYGDVGYSGGLWSGHKLYAPLPKPFHSISFSYSATNGIHFMQAWNDRRLFLNKKKVSYESFRKHVMKLFKITGEYITD